MKSMTSASKKEIVFLIGFMGVGKSFVGRQVSTALNWKYLDLDSVIEASTGKKISDIFKDSGESNFRKIERNALKTVIHDYQQVLIATGGGAPCFYDNMEIMNSIGYTVYISKPFDNLVKNLAKAMHKRPLIANMKRDELSIYVKQKLRERQRYYRQSKLIIHDYHNQELVNLILSKIKSQFNLE